METKRIFGSWPVRRKLSLLLLAIFLPIFAIILASGIKQRRDEIAKASNSALLMAQGIAAQQQQVTNATNILLTTLAQSKAVRELDAKATNRLLVETNHQFPLYSAILLAISPDGSLFAASQPFKPEMRNLSERKYFRDAVRTHKFSAGEYITGRITTEQSLHYTIPVLNNRGKLVAVLAAGFRISEFAHFISNIELPAEYAVTITDWKGTRLFRHPSSGPFEVGGDLAGYAKKALIDSTADSGFFEHTASDDVDRLFSYSKLRLRPGGDPYMYVLVSVPKQAIVAQANSRMLGDLALLGISAIMALIVAWAFGEHFLLGPVQRLVAATRRLGKGETAIRTGLPHSGDELGQLARAFDDMAELVEKRDLEQFRAEQALSRANAELERRVAARTAELSAVNAALTSEIGERKRAEQELSESQRRLETAMDAAKLGAWSYDYNTRESVSDARCRTILGGDPNTESDVDEVMGRILPEDREVMVRAFSRPQTKSLVEIEFRIKVGEEVRWIHSRARLLCDDDGNPFRVSGVISDITEQKNSEQQMRTLEEQFRHAQKMEAVGRLAGGIAHDFNNLLQVINGHAELMAESDGISDNIRRQLQAIHQAGQRAAQLTRHLLAFSRKQVLEPKTFEFDPALAGLEKMIRRMIPENIELQTFLHAGRANVRIAPEQLDQVLMNLALNARDAMPSGGRLIIETSCRKVDDAGFPKEELAPGNYVVLTVSDSGHGMQPAVRERIFEPFFTTKPLGQGTGLGLSAVYGIAHQYGGGVHVYSEPGKGSTFRVYFPVTGASTQPLPAQPSGELPAGKETVLLAEDESAVRALVRQYLEELGYRVIDASDGAHALALAHENIHTIDLLLTDAVMPQMGGFELATGLRQLRPEIKVLMMTGYAEGSLCEQARQSGIEFLSKPFSRRTLAGKIREVLDGSLRVPPPVEPTGGSFQTQSV